MLSTEYRKPPAETPPRRTVRIVRRRLPPRTALISLVITVLAAACAFIAWRLWRDDGAVAPYQRTLDDVLLTYRCVRGDVFKSKGQAVPLDCPNCGRPAHPVAIFECPSHHQHEAMVRFAAPNDRLPVIDQVKLLPGGEWTKSDAELKCSKCGLPLNRRPEDAIDFEKLKPRDPDGLHKRSAPTPAPEWPRREPGPERPLPDPTP